MITVSSCVLVAKRSARGSMSGSMHQFGGSGAIRCRQRQAGMSKIVQVQIRTTNTQSSFGPSALKAGGGKRSPR